MSVFGYDGKNIKIFKLNNNLESFSQHQEIPDTMLIPPLFGTSDLNFNQFPQFNNSNSTNHLINLPTNKKIGSSAGKMHLPKKSVRKHPYKSFDEQDEPQEEDFSNFSLDDFLNIPFDQTTSLDEILELNNFNFTEVIKDEMFQFQNNNKFFNDQNGFNQKGFNQNGFNENGYTQKKNDILMDVEEYYPNPDPYLEQNKQVERNVQNLEKNVRIVENVEKVIVHVGEKKTFRLFHQMIYYRKSTIKVKVLCGKSLNFNTLNIACHLEYKSYKSSKNKKTELNSPECWLPCETPSGLMNRSAKTKEKGVFVEYSFPQNGREIDISYCVTYNVKEMCKNTGKNYIRIHFTIYFNDTEMQEVAIPMLWDTHGKIKGESPIRVKQLICVSGSTFNKLYYRITNKSDLIPISSYDMSNSPIYLTRSYTENGKFDNIGKEKISGFLQRLLRAVNLPPRYISDNQKSPEKKILHICLMNGVKLKNKPINFSIFKPNNNEHFSEKHTQLAESLVLLTRKNQFVLVYDLNNPNPSQKDVINAFLFILHQTKKLQQKNFNIIVNCVWYFNFNRFDDVCEKIFLELSKYQNLLFLCAGGNNSEVLYSSSKNDSINWKYKHTYPLCVPREKNVLKIGALINNNTLRKCSNLGCDIYTIGTTTSVSTVNLSIICGYLWQSKATKTLTSTKFIESLLGKCCGNVAVAISGGKKVCCRVLCRSFNMVTKKRKIREEECEYNLPELCQSDYSFFNVPKKKRKLHHFFQKKFVERRSSVDEIDLDFLSFPLVHKLKLLLKIMVEIKQKFCDGTVNNFNLSPNKIRIDYAHAVDPYFKEFDLFSNSQMLFNKIDYIFKLFSTKDKVIDKKYISMALYTCGIKNLIRADQVVPKEKNLFNFSSFLELITSLVIGEYKILVEFKPRTSKERENSSDSDSDSNNDNDLSCCLELIRFFLKDEMKEIDKISTKRSLDKFEVELGSIFKSDLKLKLTEQSLNVLLTKIKNLINLSLDCRFKTNIDLYLMQNISSYYYIRDDYYTLDQQKIINLNYIELLLRDPKENLIHEKDLYLFDKGNLLLTGSNGSGKSCLLKRIISKRCIFMLNENHYCGKLPIFFPNSFVHSNPSLNLQKSFDKFPFLQFLLHTKKSNLVLFFDDFNENVENVLKQLNNSITCIISCRNIDNQSKKYFGQILQIQPLSLFQQKDLINTRLTLLSELNLKPKLLKIINSPIFQSFVRVPNLFSLLISTLVKNKCWEPSSSFNLCSTLLKHLLVSKKDLNFNMQEKGSKLIEVLENFAYDQHCNRSTQFQKIGDNENDFDSNLLNKFLPFLPLFVKSSKTKGNRNLYEFCHILFQSHLVARYLIKKIKNDLKVSMNPVLKLIKWNQNTYNTVFKKYLKFMLSEPQWFENVFLQIGSVLEEKEFIGLIHYLANENADNPEANYALCKKMMMERKENERSKLNKHFRAYNFQIHQQNEIVNANLDLINKFAQLTIGEKKDEQKFKFEFQTEENEITGDTIL